MPPELILVTGSAGRVGQAVVSELVARGERVRGFDRVPSPGVSDSHVGNLTDLEAVHCAAKGASAVIHLAATPDDADFIKGSPISVSGQAGKRISGSQLFFF